MSFCYLFFGFWYDWHVGCMYKGTRNQGSDAGQGQNKELKKKRRKSASIFHTRMYSSNTRMNLHCTCTLRFLLERRKNLFDTLTHKNIGVTRMAMIVTRMIRVSPGRRTKQAFVHMHTVRVRACLRGHYIGVHVMYVCKE